MPGFRVTGGALCRNCPRQNNIYGVGWTGGDPSYDCNHIPGAHNCHMVGYRNDGRGGYWTESVPGRGPGQWEDNSNGALRFVYTSDWVKDASLYGYRAGVLTAGAVSLFINGQAVYLSLDAAKTKVAQGTIVLSGYMWGIGTINFFLTAKYPPDVKWDEAMPLTSNLTAWDGSQDAILRKGRAIGAQFYFTNMIYTSNFIFEMRWRVDDGRVDPDGLGLPALFDYVRTRYGDVVANTLSYG